MLKSISVGNFKYFNALTTIPLSNINLFTGTNGRGKSTVLQVLLLIRQSLEFNENAKRIILNGKLVNLGSFSDIKNININREQSVTWAFEIETPQHHRNIEYMLGEYEDSKYELEIKDVKVDGNSSTNITTKSLFVFIPTPGDVFENNNELDIDFKRIHYVAADRNGPQRHFDKLSLGDFPNTGPRGEYVANVLELLGDIPKFVNNELYLGEGVQTVKGQTIEWLKELFGKANLQLVGTQDDYPVLSILMNSNDSMIQFSPTNVGFGFSYVLPILISGLIAKPGEILIVENPEAHLHPRAQSKIAMFLAKVAKTGVQVFIESHSDHVFNGLRIAVKEKMILPDNLSVLYFQDNENEMVKALNVNELGEMKFWPIGFFDQQEIDLQRLLR